MRDDEAWKAEKDRLPAVEEEDATVSLLRTFWEDRAARNAAWERLCSEHGGEVEGKFIVWPVNAGRGRE